MSLAVSAMTYLLEQPLVAAAIIPVIIWALAWALWYFYQSKRFYPKQTVPERTLRSVPRASDTGAPTAQLLPTPDDTCGYKYL